MDWNACGSEHYPVRSSVRDPLNASNAGPSGIAAGWALRRAIEEGGYLLPGLARSAATHGKALIGAD